MTSKEIDTFRCREDLWAASEGFIKIRNKRRAGPRELSAVLKVLLILQNTSKGVTFTVKSYKRNNLGMQLKHRQE